MFLCDVYSVVDAKTLQCLVMFYFFTTSTSAPSLDGLKPNAGASYESSTGSSVDKGTTPKPVDSLPPATAPGSRMNATFGMHDLNFDQQIMY